MMRKFILFFLAALSIFLSLSFFYKKNNHLKKTEATHYANCLCNYPSHRGDAQATVLSLYSDSTFTLAGSFWNEFSASKNVYLTDLALLKGNYQIDSQYLYLDIYYRQDLAFKNKNLLSQRLASSAKKVNLKEVDAAGRVKLAIVFNSTANINGFSILVEQQLTNLFPNYTFVQEERITLMETTYLPVDFDVNQAIIDNKFYQLINQHCKSAFSTPLRVIQKP